MKLRGVAAASGGVLLAFTPAAAARDTQATVIGGKEWVRVGTAPLRPAEKVWARIDTGAYYSSIDTGLARRLGIDIAKAKQVEIRSALGRTKRPLVRVQLQVAGRTIQTSATVAGRRGLTKALIGRRDLHGFLVDVRQEDLTEPGVQSLTPTPRTLLIDLPLAAFLAVVVRVMIGVRTFGVFAPVLLAIAFVSSGLVGGLAVLALMLALGFVVAPALQLLRVPRVSRLAVLVALVSATLLLTDRAVAVDGAVGSWAMAFPVIVTSVMLERFWTLWEQEGPRDAFSTAATSVLFAVGASELLRSMPLLWLSYRAPFAVVLVGAALSLCAGRYRGLRVTELARFRSVAVATGRE